MDDRPFVIVNPHSANRRTGREWPEIARALKEVLGGIRYAHTREPGDATRIAREALASGHRTIVSVGGDGTLNEVVNGFFRVESGRAAAVNPDAVLGMIPRGTGGDFRKTLGIPPDLEGAAAVLRDGRDRRIDAGMLEYVNHRDRPSVRFFLNITSFGVGGEVDERVNRSSKLLGGKISFFRAALAATLAYRNKPVRLKVDGEKEWEGKIYNVAVANGQYFGGGMWVAPEARPDDGVFDIVIMGDFSFFDSLFGGTKIYRGRHLAHPKVEFLRGIRVEATSEERVLLDVDGEQPGRLPIKISILPGSVLVRVSR